MSEQRSAPVYLNLFRINLPVGAVTSIAHRISGVLLFLSFPLLVYLLDLSLRGPDGFAAAVDWLSNDFIRLGSVVVAWSLFHHLIGGIRFLLLDLELGITRPRARVTAWLVNIAAVAAALLYLWWVL